MDGVLAAVDTEKSTTGKAGLGGIFQDRQLIIVSLVIR